MELNFFSISTGFHNHRKERFVDVNPYGLSVFTHTLYTCDLVPKTQEEADFLKGMMVMHGARGKVYPVYTGYSIDATPYISKNLVDRLLLLTWDPEKIRLMHSFGNRALQMSFAKAVSL